MELLWDGKTCWYVGVINHHNFFRSNIVCTHETPATPPIKVKMPLELDSVIKFKSSLVR